MNAVEIEAAVSELAEAPFDAAEFPYAFLAAFGNKDTTIARLRKGDTNKSDVPGGVLQRNNIHLATCPLGQVNATLNALRASPETTKGKAKFILATDGDTLEAEEMVSGETIACEYAKFAGHFGFFLPLAGISTIKEIKDSAVDVRATGRLNKLYLELLRENPDWATDERRQDMNHFMARLIFCFFAEDTGIFSSNGLFTKTVDRMSDAVSGNTHDVISTIFQAMNVPTKGDARAKAKIPGWADAFPYVNGGLFGGSNEVPRFTRMARTYLLHAGHLDWHEINPDIFGSMIQAVADDEERGSLGMHYTSVPNILKVLNPLFLDDLRAQLEAAGDNKAKLLNLRKRMARIRVFDPACGSGNFLVIAYKQMREIEAEINRRREEPADLKSVIPLTNFRGIELRSFPAEIARLALIIAEYQCDVLYRGQMEAVQDFLPLEADNWITCGNALQVDWLKIFPPTGTGVKIVSDDLFQAPLDQPEIDFENEGGETYICGNPPYLGSKWQTDEQKQDLAELFADRLAGWKSLDYVAGWFFKAAEYGRMTECASAFVATNSICQGAHVPLLWPMIAEFDHSIIFAYTNIKWSNLASNNAGVTVVIVGISRNRQIKRFLYSENEQGEIVAREAPEINAYLLPAPAVYVEAVRSPLNGLSNIADGSGPLDGGHLLLNRFERDDILTHSPEAAPFIRHFLGSEEMVNGLQRWCIWIEDQDYEAANAIPALKERIKLVRAFRESAGTRAKTAISRPHRFAWINRPVRRQIAIPKVVSERRPYITAQVFDDKTVISNRACILLDPDLFEFAIISSKLHWIWIGTVCVRMRTDLSYSGTIGWNNFPVPTLTEQNKADLAESAEAILLAREAHFPATIADLYDPDKMPEDLRRAHERNDEVLERIYIGRRFRNDTERLTKLFDLYTRMTAAKTKPAKTTIRARKTA
ncbi:DNA methyltransferase [Burkholderia contaminans]|uniref:site-specific DNA-methyltransferase (adenine-specific) n=1 Tax=Burkholderia contaminans TaxID=488447 RepID=A0A3N8PBQ2_9BURK|nr:DNA methyltransferase [Burkholderia contaminans]RQT04346.1 class I SAM-dependent DNA methyltransferase [Burkholderia contaminans]